MTPDQERMWNILGNRYQMLAHQYARDILSYKTTRARDRRANKLFSYVLNNFPKDDIVKTVHLWLSTYRLPLQPSKLVEFDRFHEEFGKFISDNVYRFKEQGFYYE